MGSSVPAVTDRLVAIATEATGTLPDQWSVTDGWPSRVAQQMFGVGTDRPPEGGEGTAHTGAVTPKDLGARTMQEDYTVPCWIYVGGGGVNQSAMRVKAFEAWDAFLALFYADPTLGGAVGPYPALIDQFTSESAKSPDEAAEGRYCLILFTVSVQNRFQGVS